MSYGRSPAARTISGGFQSLHATDVGGDSASSRRSGSFNGSNTYVDLGTSVFNIESTQAFTINAWIKPTGTNGYIFTNRNPSNSFIGLGFGIKTNGHLFANKCGSSTLMQVDTPGPILGVWSMVTWTSAGGAGADQKVYINGVLQTNTVEVDSLSQTIIGNGHACLGATSTPGTVFTGLMDEVSIYLSVLDQAAVTALYHSGVPAPVSGADHWYRFEDTRATSPDTSSTIYDRSGSADGTNHNVTFSSDVPPSTSSTLVAVFDGTASYADLASAFSFEYTNAFSINVWVRPQFQQHDPSNPSKEGLQAILGNFYQPGSEPSAILGWQFGLIDDGNANPSNTLAPYLELGAGGDQLGGATDYRAYKFGVYTDFLNTWTMVSVSYTGNGSTTGMKLYLNGVESTPAAQNFDNLQDKTIISPTNVVLGCLANFTGSRNHFFKGHMRGLIVTSNALDAATIASLYSLGRAGNPTSLITPTSYYPMNGIHDSATVLHDSVGSANATNNEITFITDPG